MKRIFGVTLPDKKQVFIGLTSIYGIGIKKALLICKSIKIDPYNRISELSTEDINKIINFIKENNFIIEGDLKKYIKENIKNLISNGTYRGKRHCKNLPVRGQRTKSNRKTAKKSKHF